MRKILSAISEALTKSKAQPDPDPLPCPFCGTLPTSTERTNSNGIPNWCASCDGSHCPAAFNVFSDYSQRDCIRKWNTRHKTPELTPFIRGELIHHCQALLNSINQQPNADIIWILPPHQGEAVHETAQQRIATMLDMLK